MARKAKPRAKAAGPSVRVRHLIAVDAANVMRRLDQRLPEMVALFSRLRDRAPMLQTVHSWFQTADFADLALLEPPEQLAVNAFYEELGELRWYLQYTEDMPTTVASTVSARSKRLVETHARLVGVIGGPISRGAAAVDAEVIVHEPASKDEVPALPAPAKASK
jgi:hypothetical protein